MEVLEKNYPVDGMIHLGDAQGYEEQIKNWAGDCAFYIVRGKEMCEVIPDDILKIQKELASFEKASRSYKKYTKIFAKHI